MRRRTTLLIVGVLWSLGCDEDAGPSGDTGGDALPDAECPEVHAICGMLDEPVPGGPVATGIVGWLVYETDSVQGECAPECGPASGTISVYGSAGPVEDESDGEAARATAPIATDGAGDDGFSIALDPGNYLVCFDFDVSYEVCAALTLEVGDVATLNLFTQFGPPTLYSYVGDDPVALATYEYES